MTLTVFAPYSFAVARRQTIPLFDFYGTRILYLANVRSQLYRDNGSVGIVAVELCYIFSTAFISNYAAGQEWAEGLLRVTYLQYEVVRLHLRF